ncbi:MAG TPA: SGNH/GDSL hydrolase family protein [Pyrinomonadaceae bacterium]|nr:SGNH/GDSL hydrolase family protein [Pyrinomonadaceae bacterium]
MRRLLKRLLLAFYLSAATFALLEVGVRVSGYSEHHLCDPIYARFDAAPEEIPYVHRPNLSGARGRGLSVVNTDSLGLRSTSAGETYAARGPGEYRVAVVGDSVTFGEGVREGGDTFAKVLETALDGGQAGARVRVFNFGASAYSVRVMEATLRRRVLAVEPNLVLLAIIPADFDLARTPGVDSHGYLSDEKLSGFLSRDSRARPVLRRLHALYLLRDVIHPLLDRSTKAEDVMAAGGVPDSYSYVKAFAEDARRGGVECRVVLLPSPGAGFRPVAERLKEDGVSFVDLSSLSSEFTPEQFRASRFDRHPSAAVHRRIGEALARHILESGLISPAR